MVIFIKTRKIIIKEKANIHINNYEELKHNISNNNIINNNTLDILFDNIITAKQSTQK